MDSSEDGECSSNVDDICAVGPIRKRRFSNARIQPTRIKKVMQSDEDIGRMVASVPVAVGSAMEHFAKKILEAAAKCVPYSSSRTLSPMHIKYAIINNPHFFFLESLTKNIKLPKSMTESSDEKADSSLPILTPSTSQNRNDCKNAIENCQIVDDLLQTSVLNMGSHSSLNKKDCLTNTSTKSLISSFKPQLTTNFNHLNTISSTKNTSNLFDLIKQQTNLHQQQQQSTSSTSSISNQFDEIDAMIDIKNSNNINNINEIKRKRGRPKLDTKIGNSTTLSNNNTESLNIKNDENGTNATSDGNNLMNKNDCLLMINSCKK